MILYGLQGSEWYYYQECIPYSSCGKLLDELSGAKKKFQNWTLDQATIKFYYTEKTSIKLHLELTMGIFNGW